MAIRALDYAPPVHLEFGDYLAAVLTADREIRPDDSKYELLATAARELRSYGMPAGAAAGSRGRLATRARDAALRGPSSSR